MGGSRGEELAQTMEAPRGQAQLRRPAYPGWIAWDKFKDKLGRRTTTEGKGIKYQLARYRECFDEEMSNGKIRLVIPNIGVHMVRPVYLHCTTVRTLTDCINLYDAFYCFEIVYSLTHSVNNMTVNDAR